MQWYRRGESLIILQEESIPATTLAKAISHIAVIEEWLGFTEAVPAFDKVGIYVEPEFDSGLLDRIWQIEPQTESAGQNFVIPVLYNGPDLADVALRVGRSIDQVTQIHQSADYRVEAVGFCPGFPYLGGLPVELEGLPRRDSPRSQVPPGSVAMTGDQCGIYPLERPGGWHLIARTPLTLVDVESEFFPLKTGDRIRFIQINEAEFDARKGERLSAQSI